MSVRTLESSPGTLGLYLSAVTSALPWARSAGGSGSVGTQALPEPVRLEGMTFEADRLTKYRNICGFTRDRLPVTAPQVLALPLHLMVMTDPLFPFAALGVVHIANTISQQRPLEPSESLTITVTCGPPQPHPRGRQLTLRTDAEAAGEVVWRAETVMLSRGATTPEPASDQATPADSGSADPELPAAAPTGPQVWRLSSDLGRRYASISGDRNPIHLFDLTAKPFGFSRHIAHGMWTKARCLAELTNRLPDAYEVAVSFRKPLSLPGTVRFGARFDGSTIDFGVTAQKGSAHLVGRIRSIDAT